MIELLIQRTLVGPGEMTVVGTPHIVFLLVDAPEIAAIIAGLPPGKFSFATLGVDAPFLVIHPAIDLVYPGMIFQMGRLMTGALSKRRSNKKHGNSR